MAPGQPIQARAHQAQAQPQAGGIRLSWTGGRTRPGPIGLSRLSRSRGVTDPTLARRTRRLVAYWDSLVCTGLVELHPYTHHHDLRPAPEQRRDHFFLAVCQTPLEVKEDRGKETIWIPTTLIIDETRLFDEDPKARYVTVFFSHLDLPPGLWGQAYPTRQEQELAYRDLIHALGFGALPKGYRKVHPEKRLNDPQQETVLDTNLNLEKLSEGQAVEAAQRLGQAMRQEIHLAAAKGLAGGKFTAWYSRMYMSATGASFGGFPADRWGDGGEKRRGRQHPGRKR